MLGTSVALLSGRALASENTNLDAPNTLPGKSDPNVTIDVRFLQNTAQEKCFPAAGPLSLPLGVLLV